MAYDDVPVAARRTLDVLTNAKLRMETLFGSLETLMGATQKDYSGVGADDFRKRCAATSATWKQVRSRMDGACAQCDKKLRELEAHLGS